MDIKGSLRELGPVDSAALAEVVLSQDEEAWKANQYRQQAYAVHTHTESLVMVFCDGWPEIEVTREAAWERPQGNGGAPDARHHRKFLSRPAERSSGPWPQSSRPGGIIAPHRDTHQSFVHSHRIHIPITTNAGVRFMINGRPHRFKPGHALRDQQPAKPQRDEQRLRRPHHLHFRLPATKGTVGAAHGRDLSSCHPLLWNKLPGGHGYQSQVRGRVPVDGTVGCREQPRSG